MASVHLVLFGNDNTLEFLKGIHSSIYFQIYFLFFLAQHLLLLLLRLSKERVDLLKNIEDGEGANLAIQQLTQVSRITRKII